MFNLPSAFSVFAYYVRRVVYHYSLQPLLLSMFRANDTISILQKQLSLNRKDTTRVNTLNELSFQFQRMDFDSALSFAEESLVLAEELHYTKGTALAHCRKSILLPVTGVK